MFKTLMFVGHDMSESSTFRSKQITFEWPTVHA